MVCLSVLCRLVDLLGVKLVRGYSLAVVTLRCFEAVGRNQASLQEEQEAVCPTKVSHMIGSRVSVRPSDVAVTVKAEAFIHA